MLAGRTILRFVPLGSVCLLLLACAMSSPAGREESALENAKTVVGLLEAAEAERDAGVSPEKLEKRAATAEKGLDAHLLAHPDDVDALVVSARLDRFSQTQKPIVLKSGQEPPDPKAAFADIHRKLDQALALQPSHAEAHYWKARLYGVRLPVFRENTLYYESVDLAQAIHHSTEAVRLEPTRVAYREALALYLVADQKPADAAEVMQSVADDQNLIRLLLNDLRDLPIPATAAFSPEDSERYAQLLLERGRFSDYPQLRVRQYVVPESLLEIQKFYSGHWKGFTFLAQADSEKVGDGEIRFLGQHLTRERGKLQPAAANSKLPDSMSGLLMTVIEYRDLPADHRPHIPAGLDLPSDLGDTFCFLFVVNYRPSR